MLLKYLNKVLEHQNLSAAETKEALKLLTGHEVAHSQIGAFLAALRMKGETAEELLGGAQLLRENAVYIDCANRDVVDIVGTGGDAARSFNISTTSAFVIAGAGIPVAKHGNRAASGKCGSADVLEELGVNLNASTEVIEYAIAEIGIGFLFARKMHPLLSQIGVIRRELKIRTIFNLLGPMCNPAGAKYMVVGVFAPQLTELFADVLLKSNLKRAMVVHGMDGLDEISCCAPTRVSELRDGQIKTYELLPELLIDNVYEPSELLGGDAKVNAAIMRSVLDGSDQGAPRAAVLINAGAAIYNYGMAETHRDGIALAAKSIDSGSALGKLMSLIEVSNG